MHYYNKESLSPDPVYGWTGEDDGFYTLRRIYPNMLVRANTHSLDSVVFDIFTNPGEMNVLPGETEDDIGEKGALTDIILDFGTETEGELLFDVTVPELCTIHTVFGESLPEVELISMPNTFIVAVDEWFIPEKGRHIKNYEARGFRFVRLLIHDLQDSFSINEIAVNAKYAFAKKSAGDFICSEERYTRVWQTSAYTARLCTRRDALWDGIKRDRLGWYGDARVCQTTNDNTFFEAGPALEMLKSLESDIWANDIPAFSFDSCAMLERIILYYGVDAAVHLPVFKKMEDMFAWIKDTQEDKDGFFTYGEGIEYMFGLGFFDWSRMPVGGKPEEISLFQFKFIEAMRNMQFIAAYLGLTDRSSYYKEKADDLSGKIHKRFWRDGVGYIHTLNMTKEEPKMLWEVNAYYEAYKSKVSFGESGVSAHSIALSVISGVAEYNNADAGVLLSGLKSRDTVPVITGFYAYYTAKAMAELGDRIGAINYIKDYIGEQIERHDSTTVWESFEPEKTDFRRWSLGTFPKSLCHGWSSGTVAITSEYLLGVKIVEPGFTKIDINPCEEKIWTYNARIPTPYGNITVEKIEKTGKIIYSVPDKINVNINEKLLTDGLLCVKIIKSN